MQSSPTQAPSATGELIASFRHGKGFLIFSLIFGVVLLALAGFVLYLGTILPPGNDGPVNLHTSRGMALNFANPHTLIYATSALLAVLAVGVFAAYVWHKKLRAPITTCLSSVSNASSTSNVSTRRLPISKTCTYSAPGKP